MKPTAQNIKPTVILVGSTRDLVRDRSVAREEKDGWVSDWGEKVLKKVRLITSSFFCFSKIGFLTVILNRQFQSSEFYEWFQFHNRFFTLDCRFVDNEMKCFRTALSASHARLRGVAPQVPIICAELLVIIVALRSSRKSEPIITVRELFSKCGISEHLHAMDKICRLV